MAAFGALSAYSATTSNTGNSFASGTVAIGDNDGGSTPLYASSDNKPGDSDVSCIRLTYTGSLASSVKLYQSVTSNAELYDLKVERGTQTTGGFPGCEDFAATSTAHDGTLGSFPKSYAAGLDGKAAGASWATNDSVVYRFTITHNDDSTPNGHTVVTPTGVHDFPWEARNN